MDTNTLVGRHLAAFSAGNVDELVEDYTDASVLITQDATIKGRDALRDFFSGLLSELFRPGTYEFIMDVERVEGDTVYIVWHASCESADVVLATDTFVLRDGKIATQTFTAKVESEVAGRSCPRPGLPPCPPRRGHLGAASAPPDRLLDGGRRGEPRAGFGTLAGPVRGRDGRSQDRVRRIARGR